ncbi:hypothetical protein LEP1GSC061_0281 [Leptospira wolffii serovar Khorat str. Khorat-H2]|nr:hypothetical protein LEP1GSC061_0281 [Leptospira wolffii serovar Khorat str. Khorat-H2]
MDSITVRNTILSFRLPSTSFYKKERSLVPKWINVLEQ